MLDIAVNPVRDRQRVCASLPVASTGVEVCRKVPAVISGRKTQQCAS
jgi:hypothetical protein